MGIRGGWPAAALMFAATEGAGQGVASLPAVGSSGSSFGTLSVEG